MEPDTTPVATVTGLYRGTYSGLEPLTKETPLTQEEVRRNPVFYELDICPDLADADLIIDIMYDNMNPVRLQDLFQARISQGEFVSGLTGLRSRRTARSGT